MPAKTTSASLTDQIPWLLRWKDGKRVVGLACLFPECLVVIPRDKRPGAPTWYCPKHWIEARNRRNDLLKGIERIEHTLDTTPNNTRGVDRRALQGDLQYLRRALVGYPEVIKIRPEAADRTPRRGRKSGLPADRP